MKKFTAAIVLTILSCISTIQGKILEIAHFQEIVPHITPDTFILLDIDDTLLIPAQMVGCDEWFNLRWKTHESSGLSKADALEKALAEWESVRHITKMKTVEKGTPALIDELQKKGHKIMGVTNQGLGLATRTVQQLQDHQVDLSRTAPTADDYYINLGGHSILFRKGVLFTSGKNKGEAFFKFCDSLGHKPKKIICIDDKASHLTSIEGEAKKRSIEFIGLRYAHADIHKAAFCSEIADFQFANSTFVKLLSDDEARQQLKIQTTH